MDNVDKFFLIVESILIVSSAVMVSTSLSPANCDIAVINCYELEPRICFFNKTVCENPLSEISDGFYVNATKTIYLRDHPLLPESLVLQHEYCHYLGGSELGCTIGIG